MLDSSLITPSTQGSRALPMSCPCRYFSRRVWTWVAIVTIAFFTSLVALPSMSVYHSHRHHPREAGLELARQPPLDMSMFTESVNYSMLLLGATGIITSIWVCYEYGKSRINNVKIGFAVFFLLLVFGFATEYENWNSKVMNDRLGANANVLMVAQDKMEIQNVRLMQMLSAELQQINSHLKNIDSRFEDANVKLDKLSTISSSLGTIDTRLGAASGRLGNSLDRVNTHLGSIDTRSQDTNAKLDKLNTISSNLGTIDTRLGAASGRLGSSLDRVNAHLGSMESHLSDMRTGLNDHFEMIEGYVKAIEKQGECTSNGVPSATHNYILYNGWFYATRDGAPVDSTKCSAYGSGHCENQFAELPMGWSLAPATRDIEENIVSGHCWDCDVLVLADGTGWFTNNDVGKDGDNQLRQKGANYATSGCSMRILIRIKC